MKAMHARLLGCLMSLALVTRGWAGADDATADARAPAVVPALAADPAVLAALAALGDNSACVLGDPKVLQELGDFAKGWHRMKEHGPGGRDFTIKMAWMPDRRRAFFCGANHGSPHRFNDAWEYDLAANTWVLLYVPDYNDSGAITDYDRQVLTLDNGWLRTRKGGPAHPAHTWWGLTYDPTIRAAVWYCTWPSYRLDAKLKAIGKTRDDLYKGPPIWCFHPYAGRWEPMPTAQPWPQGKFGASLEYVPALGGSLWQYGNRSWLLDGKGRTWQEMSDKGDSLPIESLVCHDPGRQLMIAYRGPLKDGSHATWHNALAGGKPGGWVKQAVAGTELPIGHDARSFFYFDPAGQVGLLYDRGAGNIWSYDPAAIKWTKLAPQGPTPPFAERERVLAYMDSARNVFVAIGYNSVWCYRYRRSGAPK